MAIKIRTAPMKKKRSLVMRDMIERKAGRMRDRRERRMKDFRNTQINIED